MGRYNNKDTEIEAHLLCCIIILNFIFPNMTQAEKSQENDLTVHVKAKLRMTKRTLYHLQRTRSIF